MSGVAKPIAGTSDAMVRFWALSPLALAVFTSPTMRRGREGIVPVPHSNLHRVETQSSKSSKASRNLSEAISWSLPLAKRKVFLVWRSGACEEDAQLVEHLDGQEDKGIVRAVALLELHPH